MTDRLMLWIGGGCVVASAIPFWLWKLYVITGPAVRVLIWLFVVLFGLAQLLSFLVGSRFVFRSTRKWIPRRLLVVGLVGLSLFNGGYGNELCRPVSFSAGRKVEL
ncbi:MAG: hypothetical protein ACRYFS_06085 [Janthinobacterium lividum]